MTTHLLPTGSPSPSAARRDGFRLPEQIPSE
jgi:hypothetical protein